MLEEMDRGRHGQAWVEGTCPGLARRLGGRLAGWVVRVWVCRSVNGTTLWSLAQHLQATGAKRRAEGEATRRPMTGP